jgi:hypothetical protein
MILLINLNLIPASESFSFIFYNIFANIEAWQMKHFSTLNLFKKNKNIIKFLWA